MLLCLLAMSANVFAYADETETDFRCGTDPELIQENFSALIQKNLKPEAAQDDENALVQLQSAMGDIKPHTMPSTGDVKVLVLPMEFKDEKLSSTIVEDLREAYFSEKDLNNDYKYEDLSLSDYYKKMSYGKLRLTGTVLPVYTAEENREYYYPLQGYNGGKLFRSAEIAKAIQSYKDIIGDLTEYDSDGDGYIDCLHVVWAGPAGNWAGNWYTSMRIANENLYDGIKFCQFAGVAEEYGYSAIKHETAHLLGLPDNYVYVHSNGTVGNQCYIDTGVLEMTTCNNGYINMYYKYLLGWITEEEGSAIVLTYDDLYKQDKTSDLRDIELCAAEQYGDGTEEKPKAVFFVPDKVHFPFDKFYVAEYRSGITTQHREYSDNPGILIWHCDTYIGGFFLDTSQLEIICDNSRGYLKPIYKSIETGTGNEAFVPAKDLYFEGDEFSSKTAPASEAYTARDTGAYLKVNALSQETANITAGYIDPYLGPAPEVKIEERNKRKYVNSSVTWDISYSNYDDIMFISSKDFEFITTGTVKVETWRSVESENKEAYESILTKLSGEGTIQMVIKPGTASKYGIYAGEARSEVLYVDTIPTPEPSPEPTPILKKWLINYYDYEEGRINVTVREGAEAYAIVAKYNGDCLIDCNIFGMSYQEPIDALDIVMRRIEASEGETLKIMLWDKNLSPLADTKVINF